jgi:hypothetical protein
MDFKVWKYAVGLVEGGGVDRHNYDAPGLQV